MTPRTTDLSRGGDSSSGRRAAHDRILAAARECIVRTGGPTPSIREVAEQAGVHRSTVYEYFAGRDDVLVAVFAREAYEVFMSVSHHFDRMEFLTALTRAIADGITLAHESPVLRRLVSPAGAGRTTSATTASDAWDTAIQSTLADLMAEAVERGEVRDDVPVEELIRWVVRVAISVTASPPPHPEQALEQFLVPALVSIPRHDSATAPTRVRGTTARTRIPSTVATPEARRFVDAYLGLLVDSDTLDVKIADVVRAADSSNAAFYGAFGSKDELLVVASHETARMVVAAVWGDLPEHPSPAQIIDAWVRALLLRASEGRIVAATRAFALERFRLTHRFPDAVANNVAVLVSPLRTACPDLTPLRLDAVLEMVLSLQARHIASGRTMTAREIADVSALCQSLCGLEEEAAHNSEQRSDLC